MRGRSHHHVHHILLAAALKTESAIVSMPWLSVRWPRPWRRAPRSSSMS